MATERCWRCRGSGYLIGSDPGLHEKWALVCRLCQGTGERERITARTFERVKPSLGWRVRDWLRRWGLA